MATTIQTVEIPKKARALDTSSGWQTVGSNLITNGDFATGDFTGWSDGSSSGGVKSIVGGAARLDATDNSSSMIQIRQGVAEQGSSYRVTFTITNIGTDLTTNRIINNSGTLLYLIEENGTHTFDFTHVSSSSNIWFRANTGAKYDIDNISILKIEKFPNNNHGQIYSGRGLEFDGVIDYLTTGGSDLTLVDFSAETTQANRAWTVACWVNIDSASTSHIQNVIGTGSGISTSYLGIDTNEKLTIYDVTGGAYRVSDTALNVNTWYRALWVFNGVDEIAFYLNGVADGTSAMGTTGDDADLTLRYIGARAAGNETTTVSRYFTGKMSDLQLWQGAFTAADVTYDYLNPESLALNGGGTALTESNLKLWYPMQDGHRGQQSYILDGANSGIVSALVDYDFSTDTVSEWETADGSSPDDRGAISYVADGFLRVTYTGTSGAVLYKPSTLTSGKNYKITFRAKGTHDAIFASVGNNSDVGHAVSNPTLTTDWQDYEFYITANGVTFRLYQSGTPDTGQTLDIDNILVQPINDKNHATTVFYGDEMWDIADNNVSDWVATAATSVASSEVAIGGSDDGVKLIYGSQNSNHSSYAQFTASKFLSEDLTVGRKYTVSGLFATDVVGDTNAPGVAVYASGWNYPTGFASESLNKIPATNLITNGTMEVDDNWATYNNANVNERSSTQAHNSTYSRKFTPDSASEGIQSDTFTSVTGTTYLVSFWVYPDDGTIVRSAIRNGGTGAWVKDVSTTGLTENAWNKVEYQYTEDNGGANAYIVIHSSSQTSGDFYVDDVVVTAFLEREITFTATSTTGNYLAAKNIPTTTANDLISQVNDKNSIFDEESINSSTGWQSYTGAGGTSVVSYDATEDEVTFTTTTNGAVEGMKLLSGNFAALEIGRTYTVKINMRAASGTPTVKVRIGAGNIVTDTITTSDVDYNFSVTPSTVTNSLLVYLEDTTGIDITLSKIEVFPHCNLYVDDLSFKEIGVASGWTDADQQLHIPQTALQSYNELAWMNGFDDGTDSDISCGSDTSIDDIFDGGGTFSGWILPNGDGGGGYGRIFDKGNNYLYLQSESGSTIRMVFASINATTNTVSRTTNYDIKYGQWQHVAVTYNSTTPATQPILYINGVATDVTETTEGSGARTSDAGGTFHLGNNSSGTRTFEGSITEASLWEEILTATEILELYNDGKALDATSHSQADELKAYWRNNGLSTWTDLSTNSNDGTVNNITETILIPQGVDSTRDNQGFIMNRQKDTSSLNLPYVTPDGVVGGNGNYVDIPSFDFHATTMSVSFWIKARSLAADATILDKYVTSGNLRALRLYIKSSQEFLLQLSSDGSDAEAQTTTDANLAVDTWYHIAITYSSGTWLVYKDTDAVSLNAAAFTEVTSIEQNTAALRVGHSQDVKDPFDGEIDNLLIYNDVLTSAEVERNYNATKGSHRN